MDDLIDRLSERVDQARELRQSRREDVERCGCTERCAQRCARCRAGMTAASRALVGALAALDRAQELAERRRAAA